ncbi:MAG: class I SAM-dependent methyltransferase [Chromatiales bacterium]|nr:class I SAM-dependent methyltransferase [Chromatiales bacterium]
MTALVLRCEDPARQAQAAALAGRLGIPLDDDAAAGLALVYTRERLELRALGPDAPGPVYVDFVEGRARHRRLYGGGRGQPLARAAGLKKGQTPSVVDATAGLGRDAFVLATLGCRVTLVERSPVIAALLRDGLERAAADAELGAWIGERMILVEGDAADWLHGLSPAEAPDTVYLDPMYPHRDKSALVKKEMRLFRELVGEDGDAAEILASALGKARQRVVVKRPKGAPSLEGPPPSAAIESRNTRYDLYVVPRAAPANTA